MDFIAIGDTTVDEFIRLKNAEVNCDVSHEHCTISMSWGDKIPYESSSLVYGVGNAANAAVCAARLGLKTAFVSNVGADDYGKKIIETLKNENVDISYIRVNDGIPTNHHYVLSFGPERTILIRHEPYEYALPNNLTPPKWLYLSSANENSLPFHLDLAVWLAGHPETKLAFQPGTFQIKMGADKLASLYSATELVACNKEEANRILSANEEDIKKLLAGLRALGPKIALITDGPNGAYASDGARTLKVPSYPDAREPVNRTGAGDAMTATFAATLAQGLSLEEALISGPINSMSVIQHVGAQKGLLSREKIKSYLAKAPPEYRVTPI